MKLYLNSGNTNTHSIEELNSTFDLHHTSTEHRLGDMFHPFFSYLAMLWVDLHKHAIGHAME